MGRRCAISLFGGTSYTCGISLYGDTGQIVGNQSLGAYSQEYIDLKDFINKHFMIPLIKKDFDIIQLNSFNFTFLLRKLEQFSHIYKDALIFTQLIESIKAAIEITNENEKLYEIVYGQVKDTTLLFKTTAVEFLPEIHLYIEFYGQPKEIGEFDNNKLEQIRQVLNLSEGITYDEVRERLGIPKKDSGIQIQKTV